MRWCRSTARAAAATGDRRPRPNRIANFAIANADFASAAKPRKHDEGGAGHRHLSQNTEYRSRPLPLPVGRLLFPCSALCAGPKLLRCTKTSKTHRCCRNRLVREISSKPFGIPYGRWLRERVNRAGAQVSNDGNGSEVTISGRSANGHKRTMARQVCLAPFLNRKAPATCARKQTFIHLTANPFFERVPESISAPQFAATGPVHGTSRRTMHITDA